jgi:hypothetical protein
VLENNIPRRVGISLGISDGNNTEIITDKLKEGDAVIVSSTESKNNSQGNILGGKGFGKGLH